MEVLPSALSQATWPCAGQSVACGQVRRAGGHSERHARLEGVPDGAAVRAAVHGASGTG